MKQPRGDLRTTDTTSQGMDHRQKTAREWTQEPQTKGTEKWTSDTLRHVSTSLGSSTTMPCSGFRGSTSCTPNMFYIIVFVFGAFWGFNMKIVSLWVGFVDWVWNLLTNHGPTPDILPWK